jgi:hypothetical protein
MSDTDASTAGMENACYTCFHRMSLEPLDAHSRCGHPLAQYHAGHSYGDCWERLEIRAAPHGMEHGWFVWPINFDPVWLRNCNGWMPANVLKTLTSKKED